LDMTTQGLCSVTACQLVNSDSRLEGLQYLHLQYCLNLKMKFHLHRNVRI